MTEDLPAKGETGIVEYGYEFREYRVVAVYQLRGDRTIVEMRFKWISWLPFWRFVNEYGPFHLTMNEFLRDTGRTK